MVRLTDQNLDFRSSQSEMLPLTTWSALQKSLVQSGQCSI